MRIFNHKCIFRKISYRPRKQWTNRPIYKFGSLRDFSCPSGRLQLQIWRSAGWTHWCLCQLAASALSSTWPRSWHPQPCEGETGRGTTAYWYEGLQSEYSIYLFVCLFNWSYLVQIKEKSDNRAQFRILKEFLKSEVSTESFRLRG